MCYCYSSRTVRSDPVDFSYVTSPQDPGPFSFYWFIETSVARARPGMNDVDEERKMNDVDAHEEKPRLCANGSCSLLEMCW